MTSFQTDPEALNTASKAFSAQVGPITTEAAEAGALQGASSNSGRYYAAEGAAYHSALTTAVQTLFTPMAAKTTWVATTLASTATSYQRSDRSASAGLTASGQGA